VSALSDGWLDGHYFILFDPAGVKQISRA